MHEMAIAESVLSMVENLQRQHGFLTVHEVHLLIGEMAAVEADSLRFCFDVVAAGSVCGGAKLVIHHAPLVGRCCDCSHEFAIEHYKFICPACGSSAVTIVSGRELRVDHLEVD